MFVGCDSQLGLGFALVGVWLRQEVKVATASGLLRPGESAWVEDALSFPSSESQSEPPQTPQRVPHPCSSPL